MDFSLSINRFSAIGLGIIHVFGVNSMYGLVFRNGYVKALKLLYTKGPFVLPGSDKPILTTFTGIRPLDKVVTLAGIMFCNILDGSTPQSSLYSFQFAGQLVPIWTVMMIEGLRDGNRNGAFSLSVLWGCLMQGMGYGFFMPMYCIMHLLTSTTAVPCPSAFWVELENTASIVVIPTAIIAGYVVPSIMMSLPLHWIDLPLPWNTIHQWLAGLWQGFPVWVTILRVVLARFSVPKLDNATGLLASNTIRREQLKALGYVYSFATMCAAASHLGAFAIIATRWILPVSQLVPESLTFSDTFVPPRFWSVHPMPNMAIGIQNFFQWDQYVGSAAAVLWAGTLYINSLDHEMSQAEKTKLAGKILLIGALAGPAAIVSELMRDRDKNVLGASSDKVVPESKSSSHRRNDSIEVNYEGPGPVS